MAIYEGASSQSTKKQACLKGGSVSRNRHPTSAQLCTTLPPNQGRSTRTCNYNALLEKSKDKLGVPNKEIHDMQIAIKALPHATCRHHKGGPVQPTPAIQTISKTSEPPNNKQNYLDLLDASGHPLPRPTEKTVPAKPVEYGNSIITSPDKDVSGTKVTTNIAMCAKM